jgi:hypothetical protein
VTAEFAYNKNNHVSIGVSPFKANHGFTPSYGGILSSEQCLPAVEERFKQISEVQSELKLCLEEAQFDKGVKDTPNWNVGEEVWLNSKNISTTRPSPKLDHFKFLRRNQSLPTN